MADMEDLEGMEDGDMDDFEEMSVDESAAEEAARDIGSDFEKRVERVKMTVSLPRSVAAFLRWKAEVEGMKRDELLRRIIVHYAKKLREKDLQTPPVVD